MNVSADDDSADVQSRIEIFRHIFADDVGKGTLEILETRPTPMLVDLPMHVNFEVARKCANIDTYPDILHKFGSNGRVVHGWAFINQELNATRVYGHCDDVPLVKVWLLKQLLYAKPLVQITRTIHQYFSAGPTDRLHGVCKIAEWAVSQTLQNGRSDLFHCCRKVVGTDCEANLKSNVESGPEDISHINESLL